MQCFTGGCRVLHHGDADIIGARVRAVGLLARQIAARHDAHAGFRPQALGHDFAAAEFRHVEPEEKSAGRPLVAVAVADDLVGEIELGVVQLAILFDMRLVVIGGDGDVLRKVTTDLAGKGVTEQQVRAKMDQLMGEAIAQVKAGI